jgi:hypothetical protein
MPAARGSGADGEVQGTPLHPADCRSTLSQANTSSQSRVDQNSE